MNIIHNISRTQPTAMRLMKKLAIPAMALAMPLTMKASTPEQDIFKQVDKKEIQKANIADNVLMLLGFGFLGFMAGSNCYTKRHEK